MPIPKYYEMYRPFLDCLKDGQVHSIKEVKTIVAHKMAMSEEEILQLLPSGKQAMYDNRIGWTRTYLKKAGVIDSPSRGLFVLTDDGKKVLDENPSVINDAYLNRFESFRNFIKPLTKTDTNNNGEVTITTYEEDTPQDTLDNAFKIITSTLSEEILTEVLKQTPIFFERLVVKLLENIGYGGALKDAGIVTSPTGDEGIDGIIKEDKLGFNLIYIQAKRWNLDKTISRPEIQKFVGALVGQGATKGLFITTASFSQGAIDYANNQHAMKVVLVDGEQLAKLMIEYNLGVSVETVYEVKKIDTDFFNEDL